MLLSLHERIYNLSTWCHIEKDGRAGVKISLPTVNVEVKFAKSSQANPVSMESIAYLLAHPTAEDRAGVPVSWKTFEARYHAVHELLAEPKPKQ